MTVDLLDAPLRVSWDLHDSGGGAAPPDTLARVSQTLVQAGVFFVTLESLPLLHPQAGSLLATLTQGGCRCLAVCGGSDAECRTLEGVAGLDTLFLDAAPFLAASSPLPPLAKAVQRLRGIGFEPALWLRPDRLLIPLLRPLLAFCRELGIGRIKLPNTRAGDTFGHSPKGGALRPEDLDRLRRAVGSDPLALHAGLALEVHDLFLWELLFPGCPEGRGAYGGCQAANSLAHIDAQGRLYPCSSWPEELGSLQEYPLEAIWDSPHRRRIRQEIAAPPAGCCGCRDYRLCLGGCRGLGRLLDETGAGRDPLCRGPRR